MQHAITIVIGVAGFTWLSVGSYGCDALAEDPPYPTSGATGGGGTGSSTVGTGGGGGNPSGGGEGGTALSCGNGIKEEPEECDDGPPAKSGDGCSDQCFVEDCYSCSDSVCTPLMAGDKCGPTMDGFCDNDGNCGTHCEDKIQDQGEKGVDCGGDCTKKCNGEACMTVDDCQSGHCVDDVCCNNACNSECSICSLASSLGKCIAMPAGVDDPGAGCDVNPTTTEDATTACYVNGATPVCCNKGFDCKTNGGDLLLENGAEAGCGNGNECISGVCSNTVSAGTVKKCGLAIGAKCDINEECATQFCLSGTCLIPS